jgi:hypothetical protein
VRQLAVDGIGMDDLGAVEDDETPDQIFPVPGTLPGQL